MGAAAGEKNISRTPVAALSRLATAASERATALAAEAASAARGEVPVSSIIGASGEVSARTRALRSDAAVCVAAWAPASTAEPVAIRPYAWAKPRAVGASVPASGTTTTYPEAVYCGVAASP